MDWVRILQFRSHQGRTESIASLLFFLLVRALVFVIPVGIVVGVMSFV